jgi:hypothetical protein
VPASFTASSFTNTAAVSSPTDTTSPHTAQDSTNVAFFVVTVQNETITEGGTVTLTGTVSDPSNSARTVDIHWNDSSPDTIVHLAAGQTSISPQHQYLDESTSPDGSYAVTVTATIDNSAATATANPTVFVNNATPVVSPTFGPVTLPLGLGLYIPDQTFSFTDQGTLDTHTATLSWGDSSPVVNMTVNVTGPGTGTLSPAEVHVYSAVGTYTVTVTVIDDDNNSAGTGTSSFQVTVTSQSGGSATTSIASTSHTPPVSPSTATAQSLGSSVTNLTITIGVPDGASTTTPASTSLTPQTKHPTVTIPGLGSSPSDPAVSLLGTLANLVPDELAAEMAQVPLTKALKLRHS